MTRVRKKRAAPYEIYSLDRSPLSQKPTQRDLAKLVGLSRDDLRRLANYKDQFVIRRKIVTGKKERDLAYPTGKLRTVHEKLKYQLNKVSQPHYLMSPRKGKSQRDNAIKHLDNRQYVCLDIKQFYPSTTFSMIKSWAINHLDMYEDVAGLFAEIATVDGVASFGSPLTPILVSLVHRPMFDKIDEYCGHRSLETSLWVDDLTISGMEVKGDTVSFLRETIRQQGLRSHKIHFRTGNKAVWITGIGVVGKCLIAPNRMHLKLKGLWEQYYDETETFEGRQQIGQKLLSVMGSIRHINGASSEKGMKLADQMNSLRQHLERDRSSDQAILLDQLQKNSNKSEKYEESESRSSDPWI